MPKVKLTENRLENDFFNAIPSSVEMFTIPFGKYAIFIPKGLASDFPKTINYILTEWLPNSGYQLDNRPHFEILGSNYKKDNPNLDEEVWIPIVKAE